MCLFRDLSAGNLRGLQISEILNFTLERAFQVQKLKSSAVQQSLTVFTRGY